jgi:hypothetical protein
VLHPPLGSDVTNTGLVQLAGAGGAVDVGVVVWVVVGVAVVGVGAVEPVVVVVVGIDLDRRGGVRQGVRLWVWLSGWVHFGVAVRE